MDKLTLVKVGGKTFENEASFDRFLDDFSQIEGYKILVHAAGEEAAMPVAWINKTLVARLQAIRLNAVGLTGADFNLIYAQPTADGTTDIKEVKTDFLAMLIRQNTIPIIASLAHDRQGGLLTVDGDAIAGETAKALSKLFDVTLVFCIEKNGVLSDENNELSVIRELGRKLFKQYLEQGVIHCGMIPKLEYAFHSIDAGVKKVIITRAGRIREKAGTRIL